MIESNDYRQIEYYLLDLLDENMKNYPEKIQPITIEKAQEHLNSIADVDIDLDEILPAK